MEMPNFELYLLVQLASGIEAGNIVSPDQGELTVEQVSTRACKLLDLLRKAQYDRELAREKMEKEDREFCRDISQQIQEETHPALAKAKADIDALRRKHAKATAAEKKKIEEEWEAAYRNLGTFKTELREKLLAEHGLERDGTRRFIP